MKKVLFIDRDGTLIAEFPPTYQIDRFDKLIFYPHVFKYMTKIAEELDYELVLVSNQDGMGTEKFPAEQFSVEAKVKLDMRFEGEKRFHSNCSRCHAAPPKFPARMMGTIVRHMRVRAMLTDDDVRYILRYMTQ